MKTVQIRIGKDKVKVTQFETLTEIELIFSEAEIVKNFNFGYKFHFIDAYRIHLKTKLKKEKP